MEYNDPELGLGGAGSESRGWVGRHRALAVLLAAALVLAPLGAYAAFTLSGSSSATATAPAPAPAAAFGTESVGTGTGTAGTCSNGAGGATFSCSGTSIPVGQSYTVSGSVDNPNAAAEGATMTYGDSGLGWSSSCTLNGVSESSGAAVTLSPGGNPFLCVVSASSSTADTFSMGFAG